MNVTMIKNKTLPIQNIEEAIKVIKDSENILTKTPKTWITPLGKVIDLAFNGEGKLYNDKLIGVKINSHKSKKEILSAANLNFDDRRIQITGKKELTSYDREVHDAIVTLYVGKGNKYITPQMIYRTITGNKNTKLNPKQKNSIVNSIEKMMYSRIKIIASKQECEAYGFDEFSYDGALLFAEKLTATMKGTPTEAYHLLKEPVFYTYANKKNQIERLNIKLLDSPVSKNEETIILQGYLYRRILAMKSSKKMKPIIAYDTVYKHLDIQAASDGALRKKKLKIRNTIKKILDYWKEQNFIISYEENSYKNEIVSITIRY